MSENAGGAPESSEASATASAAAGPSVQSTDATRGAMSASSAAASADTSVKTGSTSGAASNSNLRDASHDWVLKSTGLKGSHNILWPTSSSCFLNCFSLHRFE